MKNENVEWVANLFKDRPIFPDNGEDFLGKIINRFGEEGMQFTCEKEFQFELAWAMRQVFDTLGLKNHKIIFEALAKQNSEAEEKKDYFDLAIQYGDKAILVELKYKKATQSAAPWNSYLFLHDVERLEYFVGKTVSQGKLCNAKIERGYAALLTDSKYYYENSGRSKVWKNLLIYDGALRHGDLKPENSEREYEQIHLNGEYLCEWKEYHETEKYLLLEVK